MSVAGPMARNVPDLALLLSVLAGYDRARRCRWKGRARASWPT